MSLHPASDFSVPDDTAAVARAVFPQGTACLRLQDRLGPIFADEQFAELFPKNGKPAECPWRLALVTLLQFGEPVGSARRGCGPQPDRLEVSSSRPLKKASGSGQFVVHSALISGSGSGAWTG